MKIGIVAQHRPEWPKYQWIEDAARGLGHEVVRASSQQHLDLLPALHCDVAIIAQKNTGIHLPSVRSEFAMRTCPAVYWWVDLIATQRNLPLDKQPIFQSFRPLLQAADLVLVKERSLLDEYRSLGVNAHWCDQGCPADIGALTPAEDPRFDLLLWGQCGPYRERTDAATCAMRAGFKVGWACGTAVPKGIEHLPWTHPTALPQLASQARCVLSCGVRNDLDGYVSDGFWLALGMGCCVIRRDTPGLPEGPYLRYTTPDECVDAIRWVRKNPAEAIELGNEARTWVMNSYTTAHCFQAALDIVANTATAPAASM